MSYITTKRHLTSSALTGTSYPSGGKAASKASNEVERGGEKKKSTAVAEKKKKNLLKWLQSITFSSVRTESRIRAEVFWDPKILTLVIPPNKTKETIWNPDSKRKWRLGKLFWRAGVDDALVRIEQTRKTYRFACQPRSIPPRSARHGVAWLMYACMPKTVERIITHAMASCHCHPLKPH